MFTGLIAEVGKVERLVRQGNEGRLAVACRKVLDGVKEGDSIAVDGACLTVESHAAGGFTAFMSAETLRRTTLGSLSPGDAVNLEAALRPTDRLGGHMVQGHVEGVGTVLGLEHEGGGAALRVSVPGDLISYVVPKGSIALAGVSLTVASLDAGEVRVAVIPSTLEATTMGHWTPGSKVNVETDLVGRYIVTYLRGLAPGGGLTLDSLKIKGFE
jgi:riboflavin synthase